MRYDQITLRMVFATVPVFIWGIRLSAYIFARHKGEDWRYEKERTKWEARGDCFYFTVAYWYIFVG
jgi:steroid 5-alpha reductase family enzyme